MTFSVAPAQPPSEKDTVHPLIVPSTHTLRVPAALQLSQSSYANYDEPAGSLKPVTSQGDETNCAASLAAAFGGKDRLKASFSMKPGLFFTGTVKPAVDKVRK